jgi:hypothetical protein
MFCAQLAAVIPQPRKPPDKPPPSSEQRKYSRLYEMIRLHEATNQTWHEKYLGSKTTANRRRLLLLGLQAAALLAKDLMVDVETTGQRKTELDCDANGDRVY